MYARIGYIKDVGFRILCTATNHSVTPLFFPFRQYLRQLAQQLDMDELAEINGIKPNVLLGDGEEREVNSMSRYVCLYPWETPF